jgi:NitT/TauT family transport system permease protein
VRHPSTHDASTRSLAKQAAACLFWLAVWQVAAALVAQPLIFAGPVDTARAFVENAATPRFWLSVASSFAGIAAGFSLGFLLAFAAALAAHRFAAVRELLAPFMSFVKATPVACVVVLFLIWLGSDLTVVASVLLVVLPAYYFNLLEALSRTDARMDAMLRSFGVAGLKRFLSFIWPSIAPYVSAASATVVGMSWKAGVAAELIGMAANTLGERVYQAKILLETADLFAWTATVILCAWLCEKVVLALVRASGPAAFRLSLRLPSRREPARPAPLAADSLSLFAPDGAPVATGLSFEVEPGEILCVMGPSGIGKTTLVEATLGLRPHEGSLAAPARVSACFQEARLFEAASIHDNVLLAAGPSAENRIDPLLSELLPGVDPSRPASSLSGGQRRRVELARALLAPSGAVVLDEPFAGLDAATHERVARVLLGHLDGRPLLVTTHDASDARLLGASVLEMS